jgi:hypothetical protein
MPISEADLEENPPEVRRVAVANTLPASRQE